jgi:hypothetical protein
MILCLAPRASANEHKTLVRHIEAAFLLSMARLCSGVDILCLLAGIWVLS